MIKDTKEIRITAEPQMDPNVCRFIVDRPLYTGFFKCVNAEMAKGSPLLEALFAIQGVNEVLVANDMVTVAKSGNDDWPVVGRKVGAAIRETIAAGAELITKDASKKPPTDKALWAKIQKVLDEEINPGIGMHGGAVEIIDLQGPTLFLSMTGGCQGCASASYTLRHGIEQILASKVPEVTEIVDVTDHESGDNPYY
jgi:Fe-S cluster biogenesis protein NfuA